MSSVVGNPVPFKIGRKTYLVGYVSMAEWQFFKELMKTDEAEATYAFICYALRRGQERSVGGVVKAVSLKRVRRLVKKNPTILLTLVNLICEISLPQITQLGSAEEGAKEVDNDANLKTVYRLLSRMHGWIAAVIGNMSPVQVHIYLTGGPDGTGVQKMSNAEYANFRAQRGLS